MQAPSQIIYLIFRIFTISQYVEGIVRNSSPQEGKWKHVITPVYKKQGRTL